MGNIALVHDQLMEFGGAERVLVSLMEMFPEAPVYTSFYDPDRLGIHASHFEGRRIVTSWAQRVPYIKQLYSPLRFLTPLIWESFDLSEYDTVISSSGSYMCKGVVTKPGTKHICYIHHPPRYLYYYETAVEWQKHWPVRVYGNIINHRLRIWDYLSSQRVDMMIANSEETRRRVKKFYRMDSHVIYPPVKLAHKSARAGESKDYYITVSRLARAKHIDVIIRAAAAAGVNLKIVGGGRDREYLSSIAGKNVEFIGAVDDDRLAELYAGAKAFLFASVDEEFGIAPVEAMSHGLPVIAYASGGLKETVRPSVNGYLYDSLEPGSMAQAIRSLETLTSDAYKKMCRNARVESEKYSEAVFRKKITELVRES